MAFKYSAPTIHPNGNSITVHTNFCLPENLVTIASYAINNNLCSQNIIFNYEDAKNYATNLGLFDILEGTNLNRHSQPNAGNTYSPLVQIKDNHDVDQATTTISDCINRCLNNKNPEFRNELCEIIGELHDNVSSHACGSTGVSMAQTIQGTLHFAIADSGIGFRRELARIGKTQTSHEEAIKWCIKEGNSTKKQTTDEFAQRVPTDIIGNPFGSIQTMQETENHHQGLGLYKLIGLIKKYNGILQIASGDSELCLINNLDETFTHMENPWQGVAISCSFTNYESSYDKIDQEKAARIENIIDDLR